MIGATDKIFVRGMRFFGKHGVLDAERIIGQRFVVDIQALVCTRAAGASDDVGDTLNYVALRETARAVVEDGPPRSLVEALADDIAARVLREHPATAAVSVAVSKPHVAVPHIDAVGVEVYRTRDEKEEFEYDLHKQSRMLGQCASCELHVGVSPKQAKYRCPACGVASCSLHCVKAHKHRTKCSGVRNRAAPVPRRSFNDSVLMSDYTLLEETERANSAARRATAESMPPPPSSSTRSKRAVLAREAAARRVHLHLMPRGFARGRRNSTHSRGRRGVRQLFWHVDVVFVDGGKERRVSADACVETTTIQDVISGARDVLAKSKRRRDPLKTGSLSKVPVEKLSVFIMNEHVVGPTASGPEHVSVPGKAIGEDDMHRYLPLNVKDTLAKVLADRIVIEFPILYVAVMSSLEANRLSSARAGLFEKPEADSDSEMSDSSEDAEPCDANDPGKTVSATADQKPVPVVGIAQQVRVDAENVSTNPSEKTPGATADKSSKGEVSVVPLPSIPRLKDRSASQFPLNASTKRSREEFESNSAEFQEPGILNVVSGPRDQRPSEVAVEAGDKLGTDACLGKGLEKAKGLEKNQETGSKTSGDGHADNPSGRSAKRVCVSSAHGVGIPLAESSARVQDDDPPIPRLARVSASSA